MSAGGIRARVRGREGALVVFLWGLALALPLPALWVLFENRLEPVLATAAVALVLILSGAVLLDRSRPDAGRRAASPPTVALAIGVALMVTGAAFGAWLVAAGAAIAAFGVANVVLERRRAR